MAKVEKGKKRKEKAVTPWRAVSEIARMEREMEHIFRLFSK